MDLKKKKILVICLLVFICVVISIWQSRPAAISEGSLTAKGQTGQEVLEKQNKEANKICVYVSGAVNNPGLHYLSLGSRGKDAIEEAGGFLAEANKDKVNMAKRLKDGNHINVPFLPEKKRKKIFPGEQPVPEQAKEQKTITGKVNINSAAQEELEKLPGVGPSLAARIIAHRTQKPFNTIEDISKVPGIGQKKYLRLKPWLEV